MADGELVLVNTVFASQEKAEDVAALLVDAGLAVCAELEGEVLSFRKVLGAMQKERIIPVKFTVLPVRLDLFLGELKLQHPSETPQLLAWSTSHVDKDYLDRSTGKSS